MQRDGVGESSSGLTDGRGDSWRPKLRGILFTRALMFAKKAGTGRRTMFDSVDPSNELNPVLSTLSAALKETAA